MFSIWKSTKYCVAKKKKKKRFENYLKEYSVYFLRQDF